MENKIRLAFFVKGIYLEAISFLLIDRINYLISTGGYQVFIVSEYSNDREAVKRLNDSVRLYSIDAPELFKKKRIPILGYFSLKKEIKNLYQKTIDEIKPDIINVINFEGSYKEIASVIDSNAKRVLEFHGAAIISKVEKKEYKKKLKNYIHPANLFGIRGKRLYNRYNFAIVLTKEDLEDRKDLRIPIKQIYNPIILPKEVIPYSGRKNIILAIGRLTPVKNFIDLIEAVNKIKEKLNNWEIQICGYGNQKEFLEQKISEYELEEIIKLKGYIGDLSSLYNKSKLLISTSVYEGFGMSILEALSYKVPIIAYNCKCGPKEIIKDGVNGYLIDFSVEQLAEKILELTSNPEKLQEFSDHCHDEIDRFDFEKIMKQWDEFYQSIAHLEKN